MWGRLPTCGRLSIGHGTGPHIYRPIDNRPQDAILPHMTYPESVQFLYALGNEIKTAKLGLDRIRAVLAALRDPQGAFRVVHVAGTNGKGSTCAMIAAGLHAAGH